MDAKERLLKLVLLVAREAGVSSMAIGGGVAVNTYGYRRETADVDAFFHYGDRSRVLRAVNANTGEGDGFILDELDSSHWTLTPTDSPPDERLDLLFATGDPEESAIEMAVMRSYKKIQIPVFPVDLLVISKFLAERDDAKDSLDIYELLRRGAVDVEAVTARLAQMGQEEDAVRFRSFAAYLEALSSKKRRPK